MHVNRLFDLKAPHIPENILIHAAGQKLGHDTAVSPADLVFSFLDPSQNLGSREFRSKTDLLKQNPRVGPKKSRWSTG